MAQQPAPGTIGPSRQGHPLQPVRRRLEPSACEEGMKKLVTGGSWVSDASDTRFANRGLLHLLRNGNALGFRLVRKQ